MKNIYIPDNAPLELARGRSRHVAIVAHADDIEMLALRPLIDPKVSRARSLFGIVVADNKKGPKRPEHQNLSLKQMQDIREAEQKKAARLGRYSGVVFLRVAGGDIKNPEKNTYIEKAISDLLKGMPLECVYTHSFFDNHPTHRAIALRAAGALKKLPLKKRPKEFYGMEVWGSLDWLPSKYRAAFRINRGRGLIEKLLKAYKSQNYKEHQYGRALLARLQANAVFSRSHKFTADTGLIYGIDLSFLIRAKPLSPAEYAQMILNDFLDREKELKHRFAQS